MQLSQEQFAAAIRAAGTAIGEPNACTKRLVQKWETGEHRGCKRNYLNALQAATGLSARELGLQTTVNREGFIPAAIDGVAVNEPDRDSPASAPESSFSAPDPRVESVIDLSMGQLRHALNHPSTVALHTAELVETAITRLFDLERYSPSHLLAPTLNRRLATITGQLTAAHHAAVRHKLTTAAGRGALLAGWLAFDRGNDASAQRLWDDATSAAEGTADDGLFAACLVYQSYAAARNGDPVAAWHLAHSASKLTPDDPRATAWASARIARYAALANDYDAAKAALRASMAIGTSLPNPTPGDDCRPWTRSFDRAMLLATTAHTSALLNDLQAEKFAIRAVEALGTAKVKARAVVLAEAAFTTAYVGNLKRCLDYGSAAAKLTRELSVSVAADLLHEMTPRLLPDADHPAVRELLPHLTRIQHTADLAHPTADSTKPQNAPS
jgi:hypothetical protein